MDSLRSLLPEIEAAAVRGWPALQTHSIEGWLWRRSSGGSTRANSVATLQYNGADLSRTVAAVEARSAEHNSSACIAISDVSQPPGLDSFLASRGYFVGDRNVTMAKWVAAKNDAPTDTVLAAKPSAEWLTTYLSGLTPNRRDVAPRILEHLPASAIYVGCVSNGRLITSGLTIGEGRVASVQCMATLMDARRQGGAIKVLRAIESVAAREGRVALYLQTGADNLAAQQLYRRLGFSEIGRYHTRIKPI